MYTSKRKAPVEWPADDTTAHFNKWPCCQCGLVVIIARLASGEMWVQNFLLGLFSFHARCVSKVILLSVRRGSIHLFN